MIHLALLDPHPVVHQGLKSFFENETKLSLENAFYRSRDLLQFLNEKSVHVLIMEIDLLEGSLIDTIKCVKETCKDISILIFTSQPQSIYGVSLLKAGAAGYLSKQVKKEVLVEAIEKVVHSNYHITSNFANQININVDLKRHRNAYDTLSSREIEVMKYIADGRRNFEIAKILKLNQKTVSTYKKRIMVKLEVENHIDLFQQARNLDVL
jgi:DNA-binding NarL/FixJ family response regulator